MLLTVKELFRLGEVVERVGLLLRMFSMISSKEKIN